MRPWVLAAIAVAALAQTTRSVWDGVYTEEQSKRGQALYAKECAYCHGTEMTGGESAPALTGSGFLSNWTGLTVGDLFERMRVTMPQDKPGRVNRQGNADILSYILAANRFPPGKEELVTQTDPLKQIRIDEAKPK